jgi:hypothetical protein
MAAESGGNGTALPVIGAIRSLGCVIDNPLFAIRANAGAKHELLDLRLEQHSAAMRTLQV